MPYAAIGLIAALMLLIENFDVLWDEDDAFRGAVWQTYRTFVVAVLAYYAADVLWGILPILGLSGPLFVVATARLVATGAGVTLWTRYAIAFLGEKTATARLLVGAGRVIAGAILLLAAANAAHPLLFTIDEACTYHALPLLGAVLVFQVALFVATAAHALVSMVRDRTQSETRRQAVAAFALTMAATLVFQVAYPLLPLYAIGYMLGIGLLHVLVVVDEKEGYRRELARTARVRELSRTVSSLIDHMPGMTFTKDAATGTYLACNQAFAEYAHKGTPDEVVGHTDAEIFDEKTARHFVEDDRVALTLEEPLVFQEDVPDALGNPRRLQTTKLAYTDDAGRLCVLGMCEDVTDRVDVLREDALTREAYEKAKSIGVIHAHIAQTLGRGYMDLYYVDVETGSFIEYRPDDGRGTLTEVRRDEEFFALMAAEAPHKVHPEDLPAVMEIANRRSLEDALDRADPYVLTYRMQVGEGYLYTSLRASRSADDSRLIVIGLTDVDEQTKRQRASERMKEERIVYARLHALTGTFIVVHVVDMESGRFREISSTDDYGEDLGLPKEGKDYFTAAREAAMAHCHPDDLGRFLASFTKESVLREIESYGMFILAYRLLRDTRPVYVQVRAAMVDEQEGRRLVVGVNDVDAQVRQERELSRRLVRAQTKANVDALTGARSKHAYLEAEEYLDGLIDEGRRPDFAIAVLDVNDLKLVNDRDGHQAGDDYLRAAFRVISDTFPESPVFRIGGDEFVVLLEGADLDRADELVERIDAHNAAAGTTGDVVISRGMARYAGEDRVAAVFDRADRMMYENKAALKSSGPRHAPRHAAGPYGSRRMRHMR